MKKSYSNSEIFLFQLNGVSTKEMTAGTALILAEHVEKTAASIILRHVHAGDFTKFFIYVH